MNTFFFESHNNDYIDINELSETIYEFDNSYKDLIIESIYNEYSGILNEGIGEKVWEGIKTFFRKIIEMTKKLWDSLKNFFGKFFKSNEVIANKTKETIKKAQNKAKTLPAPKKSKALPAPEKPLLLNAPPEKKKKEVKPVGKEVKTPSVILMGDGSLQFTIKEAHTDSRGKVLLSVQKEVFGEINRQIAEIQKAANEIKKEKTVTSGSKAANDGTLTYIERLIKRSQDKFTSNTKSDFHTSEKVFNTLVDMFKSINEKIKKSSNNLLNDVKELHKEAKKGELLVYQFDPNNKNLDHRVTPDISSKFNSDNTEIVNMTKKYVDSLQRAVSGYNKLNREHMKVINWLREDIRKGNSELAKFAKG